MTIQEYVMLHMVRERMQETMRQAEQRRALRGGVQPARRSLRVHVGLMLVRLGRGLLGRESTPSLSLIEPGEGRS